MASVGPSWFASDQLHRGAGGWYIGARGGFSLGPYESRAAADAEAEVLRRHLAAAPSAAAALEILRRVIEQRQHAPVAPGRYGRATPPRDGEPPTLAHRSPRVFALYGRWYFSTREGMDVGPYASQAAADRDARRLVALLERCPTQRQRRLAIIDFITEVITDFSTDGAPRSPKA